MTVQRSKLKEHPDNPRVIGTAAEKRLHDKMKEVGLLQPLIVNKRTMHIIGGHQRVHQLDKLQKYNAASGRGDYEMDVALVDLDEKQEREMLVFLNNPSAMGDWDLDALAKINLTFKVPFESMGFDKLDAGILFEGDPRFDALFGNEPQVIKDVKRTAEEIASIKEAKKAARGKFVDLNNADFYFVVLCSTQEEKAALMAALGQPAWEQVCSADAVTALCEKAGVKLDFVRGTSQADRKGADAPPAEARPGAKKAGAGRKGRARGERQNGASA